MVVNVPRRDRPVFPEPYGIATGPEGMLCWEKVEAALTGAVTYWIATSGDTGSPHLVPIWGAWTGARLYIEGGDTTRWARNLAADPRIQAGADAAGLQLMVRGVAGLVTPDADAFEQIAGGYATKYPYRPQAPGRFWEIIPRSVLAWEIASMEAFASTPTRFHFEEQTP